MLNVMNNYLEIFNANKITGRRNIKAVIHEIYDDDSKYNKNGISWNENYTQDNIDTVANMPICVEFIDFNNSEPFGHGMSGVKDGKPLFENSVMVGVFENANIEEVEVKGKQIKALVGSGYINEQRYPLFVRWLTSEMFDKKAPEGSVEICAKDGKETIVYDGGWKEKGRVPQIYDYTGYCILGIEPADDSAVVLELNNYNKKEDTLMSKEVITELNNKIEEKTNEINQLQNQVQEKDKTIDELNSDLEKTKTAIEENSNTIGELNNTIKEKENEIESITKELNELKAEMQKLDNERLISELNSKLTAYTDEEKEIVKEKIETFNKEPSEDLLSEIIIEINNSIAKKILEERSNKAKSESNAKADDIYGDIYETNEDEVTEADLY